MRTELGHMLGRGVALCQQRTIALQKVPLATGRKIIHFRMQHCPPRLVTAHLLLPRGHASPPVGVGCHQFVLDGTALVDHRLADLSIGGAVDRYLGLIGIVEEREQAVVLFVRERVVFVRMALSALDGEA